MTHATLPRRGGSPWVTDGGLETDLIFNHGVDLPDFAAFPLLADERGRQLLRGYYDDYAAIAATAGAGLLLESPTWRANPDWGTRLGYDRAALDEVNSEAIRFLRALADGYAERGVEQVLVSGQLGPRGDGYRPGAAVDPAEAAAYHRPQVEAFAAAGADVVTAYTLTDAGEAIGIVAAARAAGVPVAISFTVETDGRLPGGATLAEAVAEVDEAGGPDHFLVNCAHPLHVLAGVPSSGPEVPWQRVIGIRANASTRSHAELDEAEDLDAGDLTEFVGGHRALASQVGEFAIVGGCCGTDATHVAALWGVREPANQA